MSNREGALVIFNRCVENREAWSQKEWGRCGVREERRECAYARPKSSIGVLHWRAHWWRHIYPFFVGQLPLLKTGKQLWHHAFSLYVCMAIPALESVDWSSRIFVSPLCHLIPPHCRTFELPATGVLANLWAGSGADAACFTVLKCCGVMNLGKICHFC